MNIQPAKKLAGLIVVIVFSLACGMPGGNPNENIVSEGPTTSTESTATPLAEAPTASIVNSPLPVGGCSNPYYPVREGSTWNYKSTGSPAGDYSFTDTITPIRADGFTLQSQFGELTRTQDWACTPDGLVALQLGGGAVQTQNLNVTVQSQKATGVMYPAEVAVGDQWDYNLEFTGSMDIAGNSGEANGNVTSHFTALGPESVTVPAGSFLALKIQVDTTMTITATFQGVNVPVTFSTTYIYWFVQDTGWVKAVGTGNASGQSFSETIELQWYNLP